jgi:hypothetical protein
VYRDIKPVLPKLTVATIHTDCESRKWLAALGILADIVGNDLTREVAGHYIAENGEEETRATDARLVGAQ